jgi:2-hydroxy-6-oxo-6-(2'-aminophenyl)hexa-2,4-dienoate hydrolase
MALVSKHVDVLGLRTHYLEQGAGPTLVLVHGGGSGADSWGNWHGCFDVYAENFHVVALDMPGFGRTEKPDPTGFDYGQASRNRHLAAFIRAISAEPVHLIGNSMGGATALGVAMAQPGLVSKLVLMGAAGLAIANPDPAVRDALGKYDFTLEGMRRLVSVLAGPNFHISDEMIKYRHALTTPDDARRALKAIAEKGRTEGLSYPTPEIAKVKHPTLVIGGKLDQVAILARTYGYLDILENSWGFVLPHCGHWVMLESPKEFAAVTTLFLRNGMFQVVKP